MFFYNNLILYYIIFIKILDFIIRFNHILIIHIAHPHVFLHLHFLHKHFFPVKVPSASILKVLINIFILIILFSHLHLCTHGHGFGQVHFLTFLVILSILKILKYLF